MLGFQPLNHNKQTSVKCFPPPTMNTQLPTDWWFGLVVWTLGTPHLCFSSRTMGTNPQATHPHLRPFGPAHRAFPGTASAAPRRWPRSKLCSMATSRAAARSAAWFASSSARHRRIGEGGVYDGQRSRVFFGSSFI